ncbi:long-chain-fatty-acid--CoA ligase ACSBG2 isoform X2 [Hydra vulgaris]|uniref:long-chain-fatty-acid--CoA ligase n=1 Tax=Hydra vulgaris TaxID=6087 RepID=A0ABM4DDR0_HYDVU
MSETKVSENSGVACNLAEAKEYWTCNRKEGVKIRFSGTEDSLSNSPAISIPEFYIRAVNKFFNRTAIKIEREGQWTSWTFQKCLEEVRTAAKAFIKLGLEPLNSVGILGSNSPEWFFADVGTIFAGGIVAGIYPTNSSEMCQFICEDSHCNIVVVENEFQLKKILEFWDQLPFLHAVVQYTGEIKEKRPNLYTWSEFMEIGRNVDDSILEQRVNMQAPNKCCILIYTSGTTGNPKGVMLSHDNICINAICVVRLLGIENDSFQHQLISYLPLSHIAAQIIDIWISTLAGACLTFAQPDALKGSLIKTIKQVRPTLFGGVPRVYEKIEESLKSVGANMTGFKKKLSSWTKQKLLLAYKNHELGESEPFGTFLAKRLIKKLHRKLGLDRCQMLFCGAAPISKETLEYFQSLCLPLNEIYGMSESTGPVTMSTPKQSKFLSVGKLLSINEGNILNPDEIGCGELSFRGRNVMMGYLNSEQKTKEVLSNDGWLRSGDVGKRDKNGFFYITGRIKELIITAGGENIAPVPIEDNIKAELPLISIAMVIGDQKKYLTCLLTLRVEIDMETGLSTDKLLPMAVKYCSELGVNATKSQEIAPNVPEPLRQAIQSGIDCANKKAISNASKVQKWTLLPFDFTTVGGELGPTQKLRRPHVMKMYQETIDEMYKS